MEGGWGSNGFTSPTCSGIAAARKLLVELPDVAPPVTDAKSTDATDATDATDGQGMLKKTPPDAIIQ